VIRSLPDRDRSGVPIIALSASTLHADVEQCFAAGMNDHIAKPVDAAELSARLVRWILRPRLASSTSSGSVPD
jgi:two-component system, sensor histidine kinase and response regulator